MNWLQQMDWQLLYWLQNTVVCDTLDVIMPIITALGDGGFIWILAGILLLCTKKYRRYGLILLIGLGIGALLGNLCLKPLFARPRPCWLETGIPLLIANPTDYSFPSGHTLAACIGATILTLTNGKFGFGAIPLACLIAFSRLYLFVHFPSDVMGGAILGIGIGCFSYFILPKIWRRKQQE